MKGTRKLRKKKRRALSACTRGPMEGRKKKKKNQDENTDNSIAEGGWEKLPSLASEETRGW